MANDKEWQRRTDDWIEATNQSRKRKEERLAQRADGQDKDKANGSETVSTSTEQKIQVSR